MRLNGFWNRLTLDIKGLFCIFRTKMAILPQALAARSSPNPTAPCSFASVSENVADPLSSFRDLANTPLTEPEQQQGRLPRCLQASNKANCN